MTRQQRYRQRLHVERYGPGAGDMRGRHGRHAIGPANGKWNGGQLKTSHGYVLVRVEDGHHLQQAHGYAYEHQLVAEQKLGRHLFDGEVVHHVNGDRADNRPENLDVHTLREHAEHHAKLRERDASGRFGGVLTVPASDPDRPSR